MNILEGLHKAYAALINEGVKKLSIGLDEANYYRALAEAWPELRRFRFDAKRVIVLRQALSMKADITPDAQPEFLEIWVSEKQQKEFQWSGVRIVNEGKTGLPTKRTKLRSTVERAKYLKRPGQCRNPELVTEVHVHAPNGTCCDSDGYIIEPGHPQEGCLWYSSQGADESWRP